MSNLRIRKIMRYDASNKIFRVCRVMWERGIVGDGNGYSAKLTFGLCCKLLFVRKEWDGFRLTLLGVRLHFRKSYGGINV